MRRVRIDDIARRAGVSPKTVSRVVNREQNVSDELRAKVEKVIAQLNYEPDRQARSLRSGRSFHISFAYTSPSSHFVISLLHGIRRACRQNGYLLVPFETEEKGSKLVLSLLEFVERERLDGLLLMPPMTDNEQLLAALEEENILFGRIAPGDQHSRELDVVTNDRAAGHAMADHLLQLGHRHIAYIAGHPDHLAMAQRLEGLRDRVHDQANAPCKLEIWPGKNTFESGLEAARVLLSRQPRPTAIFAANDDMACGVLFEAHDRGLQIPGDLSIAGFDDMVLAARVWPGLTTIHQPVREMGETATQRLIDCISGRSVEALEPLASRLVVRRSTGGLPASRSPG
jgi:LacI family transcriptional regulator